MRVYVGAQGLAPLRFAILSVKIERTLNLDEVRSLILLALLNTNYHFPRSRLSSAST
jgi:hypothetical protein